MSDHLEGKDWRELSEAASREQDPERLMQLIRALNRALEEREQKIQERNRTASFRAGLEEYKIPPDGLAA